MKVIGILYDAQDIAPGEPGFGPGLTDPESVVLPLHYSPIKTLRQISCLPYTFYRKYANKFGSAF